MKGGEIRGEGRTREPLKARLFQAAWLFSTSAPQGKAVGAMKSASLPQTERRLFHGRRCPARRGESLISPRRCMNMTCHLSHRRPLRVGATGHPSDQLLSYFSGESQLSNPVAPPGCQSRLMRGWGGRQEPGRGAEGRLLGASHCPACWEEVGRSHFFILNAGSPSPGVGNRTQSHLVRSRSRARLAAKAVELLPVGSAGQFKTV